MYDLLIKNGTVINGTGSPAFYADIAVKDGKIARIGKGLEGARTVIDAAGLTVTPGFIDSHSHSENAILTHPGMIEKVEQGITTSVAGQCGSSPAPISRDDDPAKSEQLGAFGKSTDIYRTFGTFLNTVKDVPTGANTAVLVGHAALRKAVMGMENRAPNKEELDKMKDLLTEGMECGALGLSFGLFYAPGAYAATEEAIELAKVVGEYHGIVAAHIRDESDRVIQSVDEFIAIIRASGARGIVSHHKAMDRRNWGKVHTTLRMIDEANREGLDIYCDVYPYTAYNTSLSAIFIPPELLSYGVKNVLRDPARRKEIRAWNLLRYTDDLSWVQVTTCQDFPPYMGLRVSEIARKMGVDDYEAVFELIAGSEASPNASCFAMCEEDVETVLAHPRSMICTDSGVARHLTVYHPRLRGAFPRVLGRYVRERGVTTLPEMIRKMTSMPASVYGFRTKGLIWEGMDADICIFDAEKIRDNAEFTDCGKRADGLNYVIVNGEIVVRDAVYQGGTPGGFLLRNK